MTETTVGFIRGGDLGLNFETGTGYSGGPVVLRDGSVVGLVFGTEGRFGLAVLLSEVENYLREYAVSWGSTAKAAPLSSRIVTGESVEALRKTDAVRALQPLEDSGCDDLPHSL